MALIKTVAGLVLRDDFTRADSDAVGGSWSETVGDWDIVSNRCRIVHTAAPSSTHAYNSTASKGEQFVQGILRAVGNVSSTAPGLMARYNGTNSGLMVAFYAGNTLRLEWLNVGSPNTLATIGSLSFSQDTDYLAQLYAADGVQEGHINGTNISASSTSVDGTNRGAGLWLSVAGGTRTGEYDDFMWFLSKNVRVHNMTAGWKAKIINAGGSVVAEATESGGTATIDCSLFGGATEKVPYAGWAKLRITDGSDVTQNEITVVVYPGDEFDNSDAPEQPIVTAAADGPYSVHVETTGYTGTNPIAAVICEIAEDPAFTVNKQTTQVDYADPAEAPDIQAFDFSGLTPSTLYYVRARYKDDQALFSIWSLFESDTTFAATPPNTPTINTAVASYESVVLTGTAYSDGASRPHEQSDWQIDESGGDYSTPVVESLEDPTNLESVTFDGLTAGTAYIARVRYRADDGAWSAYSANKAFSTIAVPVLRPNQPIVTVSDIGLHGATFSTATTPYSDAGGSSHFKTQWWLTVEGAASFPGFGLGWLVENRLSQTELTEWIRSNLAAGTEYGIAARYLALDGDYGPWSAFAQFTTLTHPLGEKSLNIITPRHGEVDAEAFSISWTPASFGGTTFEADYRAFDSDETEANWTSIFSGVASSPQSWNVSALAEGHYLLRLRAVTNDAQTDYNYRIVYVDQLGNVIVCDGNATWSQIWNQNDINFNNVGGPCDYQFIGGNGIADDAGLDSGLARTDIGQYRSLDITAQVLVGSTGGPFPWNRYPEQSWTGIFGCGDGAIVSGVPYKGITATIYSEPIWPYSSGGNNELRGTGNLKFSLGGWEEFSPGVGGRPFLTEEVVVGTHHFVDFFDIGGVILNKVPRYGIRLRIETLEIYPDTTRKVRVRAAVFGKGVIPPSGGWHIDTTRDTNLLCGYCGYDGRHITTTYNPYAKFDNLIVVPIATCAQSTEETGYGGSTGRVWMFDIPKFQLTGEKIWHRRTRESSRPAIVNSRDLIYAGVGNTTYKFDRTGVTGGGYWISPTLNRGGSRIADDTLRRIILRYEAASATTITLEASGDGGVTWNSGWKTSIPLNATTGGEIRRAIQAFNVTGYDLRVRITFPANIKVQIHALRAEIVERGQLGSE